MIDVVSFGRSGWEPGLQNRITHEGLISMENSTVLVEIRTCRRDFTTFARTDAGTRAWRLPLDAIDGGEVRNRLFGGVSLRLRTRSLTLLDGLPGCVGREFRAPVPRRDRDAARAFAANLNDLLADRLLRWLDDDHPDLPRLQ
jgi:hypothetical protein